MNKLLPDEQTLGSPLLLTSQKPKGPITAKAAETAGMRNALLAIGATGLAASKYSKAMRSNIAAARYASVSAYALQIILNIAGTDDDGEKGLLERLRGFGLRRGPISSTTMIFVDHANHD